MGDSIGFEVSSSVDENPDHMLVERINIELIDSLHISLGDIISKFGPPDHIKLIGPNFKVTGDVPIEFDYPDLELEVYMLYNADDWINPAGTGMELTPQNYPGLSIMKRDWIIPCNQNDQYCEKWQGFKPVQYYLQLLPPDVR